MLRAAIYGRKSTEEHQVDSIPAQLDFGGRFCERRELAVVLIETDTASGAEWAPRRRPGIYRIRDAAVRGDIDVVIARDDSRIGRDMLRTPLFVQDLADAGVKVIFYSTGEEWKTEASTDRLMAMIRGYKSEQERTDISSRTRDALERRARAGLVAGGKVYGYTNVRSPDGVRRVIEPREAAVVRELFEGYAAGEGIKALAKRLNARGVPCPRGGDAGWVPSCIGTMLRRDLYAGRVTWGRVAKSYRGGTKIRSASARELVHLEVPELAIVDAALWQAAQADRGTGPRRGTRLRGRPARYLLSGVLRCGTCSGPLTVASGKSSHAPIRVYTCAHHRERGTCASTLRREVGIVDAVVLDWVTRVALREEILVEVLAELRSRLAVQATEHRTDAARLEVEAERARAELERLVDAAASAPPEARAPFYSRVAERQRALSLLEDRLRACRTVPPALDLEVRRLERDARAKIEEMRATCAKAPEQARALVELLFPDGIVTAPEETAEGRRMRLEGEGDIAALLGLDDASPRNDRSGKSASPAGRAPLPLREVA